MVYFLSNNIPKSDFNIPSSSSNDSNNEDTIASSEVPLATEYSVVSNIPLVPDPPFLVEIPVHNRLVERAYKILTELRISQSTDEFNISLEKINHSDMREYTQVLFSRYEDANEDARNYIRRLQFNDDGQQFVKAISVGVNNVFFISIIAARRHVTAASDVHRIFIATMKNSVDLSLWKKFKTRCIGMTESQSHELDNISSKLNNEDNKRCFEAMVFHTLGRTIKSYLGNNVDVRFTIENNQNDNVDEDHNLSLSA